MINAGLPLVQCLEVLGRQQPKPHFKQAIQQAMIEVEGGQTLSESLTKQKHIFGELYINMIAAGETGGILDTILQRLAVFLEKNDALQRKVKGALTYPAIVLFVALGACIFMLMGVIPVFAKMFSDFGGELPLPTQIVMNLSISCATTGICWPWASALRSSASSVCARRSGASITPIACSSRSRSSAPCCSRAACPASPARWAP
jgi:type II secretory pathway component PulF